ncbi:MAG: GTP 3',8-cyclase MoaA [Enterobacterales bacterium]|nr:GTP 3',8-cyclase MoaA [Enterobacterales bacterium]
MTQETSSQTAYVDPHGRRIDYVRLSVIDRCDLRCFYCIPKGFKDFEVPDDWLTFDEIQRLMQAFCELGISNMRVTGGEPLLRPDLAQLVANITAKTNIEDISMSTNAVKLAKYADDLKAAGVERLNISLDTLNPETFKEISGGKLAKVIDGILAAKDAGFSPIKINMVVMKGINDHQVSEMLDFCSEHGFILRLIETMPMGNTGKDATQMYVDLQDIKAELEKHTPLTPAIARGAGPARYYKTEAGTLIGFITPISQHFCDTCNRVRIGADGTLYLCLGQEHSYPMRPVLRSGASITEIKEHLIKALALKPKKHEFKEKPDQIIRIMSVTGG